jgi:hypothetical protein
MERKWRLDDDLITSDSLLDGLTFDDLILAAHHTEKVTPETVRKNMQEIIDSRLEDAWFLVEKNMDAIILKAMQGRE